MPTDEPTTETGGDWGRSRRRRPAQREFVPMCGVKPLDTYDHTRAVPRGFAGQGRPDCPCGGAIGDDSLLVCMDCHLSGYHWVFQLERQASMARRRARQLRRTTLAQRKAERQAARDVRKRQKAAAVAGGKMAACA